VPHRDGWAGRVGGQHAASASAVGPAFLFVTFLPLLRTGKGRIINISAPTARVPVPFMAPIGGSKAALASFSDSLRLELGTWGIPVTVIEPGGTDTAIFQKAETATQAALGAADPAKVALYSDQLAAVAKAAAKLKLGPADAVAKTIVAAVEARKLAGADYAATQIGNAVGHLDALVNNAGLMIPTRQTTSEGVELNFAVHHLAPYSMTSKLLPMLTRGAGRVVNVNSEGHRAPLLGGGSVRIDFDDLGSDHGYDPFLAYSRTKLANLLFSYELQRRHPELSVVAVHPGMVRTRLGRHWPRIQVAAMHAMSISARKGAEPLVSLATAPAVERGAYYNRFTATRSSSESYDQIVARRLWEVTESLRGPFGQ
jgi:retinol dehydrogenase 12